MKKIIFLLFVLLSANLTAQTQKLSELSKSKILDAKIIYEENREDIYGYFYLFQKDKTQKEEVLLEYVVLDKNLNKITSGSFLQQIYSSLMVKTTIALQPVIKNQNTIMFATALVPVFLGKSTDILFGAYYRTLDLVNFKLSNSQTYIDFKKIENYTFSKNIKPKPTDRTPQLFKPTNCNGYVVLQTMTSQDYMNSYKYETPKFQEFRFYDKELNEKWVYKYNLDEKSKSFYRYELIASDGTNLIFSKFLYKNPSDFMPKLSIEVIDSNTGLKKSEIVLDDDQNLFAVYDVKVKDNLVTVFAATNNPNRKEEFKYNKITGYAKIDFDASSGKTIDRNFFNWNMLEDKFKIDEFGEIKSYGYIEFIDFRTAKDGKTVVIGEGYDPAKDSKILDLFVFVFDKKMKLIDYRKIEKVNNRLSNINATGNTIYEMGGFDYMYSQKLSDDDIVFYYTDNEKKGFFGRTNSDWVLGIVTYVDGKIDTKKVSLKAKVGNIIPFKAKKGYILLRDESELRLEKINY
jgi:hypothetical protein